jgi:hypothetical protein
MIVYRWAPIERGHQENTLETKDFLHFYLFNISGLINFLRIAPPAVKLHHCCQTPAAIDPDNSLHTATVMRNGTEAAPSQTSRPGILETKTDLSLEG